MARRPFASATFAALLLALAAPAALPGCAQRPQQAPLRSLDRSGRVSLACIGYFGDTTGNPGRSMFECDSTLAASIGDFGLQLDENGNPLPVDVPHVYALVTQQTRGEVAVIDLSVDPAVTQSILDADLNTPGLNFLPVGAQPVDVVTSGLGGGAFVASAEPGRPGIYGLPATDLRGPSLQGEGAPTATLRSWPACRLPSAPGRMLVIESALAAADPAARLCPSPNLLRDAEPFQQRAPWAGSAESVHVVYPGDDGYVPLEGENVRPCGAEGAELPPYCARLACGDEGAQPAPLCKPQLVPRGSNAGAEKLLVTLPERGELLVIDAQTLFERPPGSFDPCPIERAVALRVDLPDAPPPAPEAGESCPALPATPAPAGACPARPERSVAYPAAFEARPAAMALGGGRLYVADEGAPVIHVLSVENGCDLRELPPLLPSSVDEPGRPVYTSALSVSPLTSDQRTFLYAVDRERGGLMAFDVSAGSADRSPLVRERPDLKLFGARDRLAVGGPVREITFVEAAENVLDENGFLRNGACDPDTSSVDPDRGDVFRTTDDYAGGARPTRLRGVFALATLTSGQVRILDVDDLDAACRGARTAGGFPERSTIFSDLPAALTGCESCAIGTYTNTLGASNELSCNVVERHELRSGFFFANKSATGLHAPTFQSYPILSFNGASLRTDATEEAGPNPKLLGPAVPNPFYAPGTAPLAQGHPAYDCRLHSPDLVDEAFEGPFDKDCPLAREPVLDPTTGEPVLDMNGQPVTRTLPNPNYATFGPNRPSLDAAWSFERGGLPVAADSAPARAERNFVVPDFREPRAHVDQNWTAWFEGPLPGFEGRYADSRLGSSEPEVARRGFFDPDASFCGAGVHDWAAARLEGARLLGVPADTSDPGAAAALDRFADRHADYVQIAEELKPPEDPYWTTAATLPPAERCDYYSCEATFGPASNPTPSRDFVVREAYQDRLFVSDAGPRALDPDCCFPTLVRYRLRTHNAWTVVGGSVGFSHRTVVDAATGRCVDQGVDPATGAFCDPLVTLRNGRAYEAVNPGAAADPLDADPPPLLLPELVDGRPAADVRWPCRDESGAVALDRRPGQAGAPCFAPSLGDRLTFRNGVLSFIPYQGLEPSRRDMIFSWSMTGGFVPLQIDLGGRGALVAPFAAVFSPELRRLVVTDGGQGGVFSASLATFGFRTYL
ncbi:MAG TPA: hypothetical protein VFS43_36890 [Polyangiaceae bacterium]|nr:hypothetical protein [Polyangiaceae bacterium]